ncbi:MAG: hypothetical protein VYD64_04750 [Pseudomonadota bacterium]|nr:hypothetical protein [Pseudomonadota bacterium]
MIVARSRILFLSCMVLMAAVAGPAAAAEFRKAQSGRAAWMDDYYGWDNRCRPKIVNIDVVREPAHGKISPRPKSGRIPRPKIGSATQCVGKPLKGWSVYYTSRRGYRGVDNFTIRMSIGGTSKLFNYRVTVR